MSDQGHLILSNPLKIHTESDTACTGRCKVVRFFSLENSCEQEEATMGPFWYREELNDWNIYQMFAHSLLHCKIMEPPEMKMN